jgi:WD40 repeat protein
MIKYRRNLTNAAESFIFMNESPEYFILCERNGTIKKLNNFYSDIFEIHKFSFSIRACLLSFNILYIANNENRLVIFDIENNTLKEFLNFPNKINAITINVNLKLLACACSLNGLIFFNLENETFQIYNKIHRIHSLAFDPQNIYFNLADNENIYIFKLYKVNSQVYLKEEKKFIHGNWKLDDMKLNWHPNGIFFAILYLTNIQFCERSSWRPLFKIETNQSLSKILFSPSRQYILCIETDKISIYDLITLRCKFKFSKKPAVINNVLWNKNNLIFTKKFVVDSLYMMAIADSMNTEFPFR